MTVKFRDSKLEATMAEMFVLLCRVKNPESVPIVSYLGKDKNGQPLYVDDVVRLPSGLEGRLSMGMGSGKVLIALGNNKTATYKAEYLEKVAGRNAIRTH